MTRMTSPDKKSAPFYPEKCIHERPKAFHRFTIATLTGHMTKQNDLRHNILFINECNMKGLLQLAAPSHTKWEHTLVTMMGTEGSLRALTKFTVARRIAHMMCTNSLVVRKGEKATEKGALLEP